MSDYRKIWQDHYGPIPVDEIGRSYEIHHIDGNKKNNNITNLIALSIKDHFEIHLKQGDYESAQLVAARMYKEFSGWKHKEETIKKISESLKGKKRKPFTEETRRRMSERKKGKKFSKKLKQSGLQSKKGIIFSEETRRKISEAKKGKKLKLSEEERLRRSQRLKGIPKSEEHKTKVSNKKKGMIQEKLECPHCKLLGGITNMKRYHFNNCKSLKN